MMKTEDKESGGRLNASSHINIARPTKNLSHPALCQRCGGEYAQQEDGPDAGKLFVCSMIDNLSYSCNYFRPKPCAPVIDAEELVSHRMVRK